MSVSERQREANRRNAQKSTGPTSDAGKARAARNATTHGLTANLPAVGLEAEQARAERIAVCLEQYNPRNGWEIWLVEEMAGVSIKLGRIWAIEARLRTAAAVRARTELWDLDRQVEAEDLGARLARHPARVVAQLRQSPQGCDWLTERWTILAQIADCSGWNDEQTQLAHHLLGRPTAAEGQAVAPIATPGIVARQQLERLQSTREIAVESDKEARALVEAGDNDIPNRDIANLRRYERATRRHLYWLIAQMRAIGLRPHPTPESATVEPQSVPLPAPQPTQPRPIALVADPAQAERNEPISPTPDDETKPFATEPTLTTAPEPARKRPDLARIAKRERKARRKQGQRRR